MNAIPDTAKLLELARPAFARLRAESLRLARVREWRAAEALYAMLRLGDLRKG